MGKKLYVGNLPFSVTETELRELFGRHGSVDSVNVITDRETGRPRGFAFVEMSEPSAATDAIRALDGTQLGFRVLTLRDRTNACDHRILPAADTGRHLWRSIALW